MKPMWKFGRGKGNNSTPNKHGDLSEKDRANNWRWIERGLFSFGLGLLAVFGVARLESYIASRAALKSFAGQDALNSPVFQNSGGKSGAPERESARVDENSAPAQRESTSKEPGSAIAVLQIPKLHLAVLVLDGTDALTLNHALGRIAGTARPGEEGNIGIAGHRDGFFRGLKDVRVGDEIDLKTLKGTEKYAVDRIRIVTPDNVGVLQPRSAPSLTLVTCYPFYFIGSAPQRYIVMASLMHERSSGSGSSMPGSESQISGTNLEKTMTNLSAFHPSLARNSALTAVLLVASLGSWAQDTSTTSVRHGAPSFDTNVRNAEIVYVEGNDLVLKLENGRAEHLIVPSSEKFTIDGREVSLDNLKAGTKLTQTITTTTTPHYVNTVRVLKGKVWHVNAPGSVILSLPDGSNQVYKVPSHATFTINGQKKTVFDLKKGMKLEATIVTDERQTVVELSKANIGQAPVPTPATPALLGVLLLQQAEPVTEEVASNVTLEQVDKLPNTASSLPLAGLLGLLGIGSAMGLGAVRRRVLVKA
jgi:sortase A